MRRAALVLVVALVGGCGGGDEPERELQPGSRVRIGVVAGERIVAEGARVEVNRIDNAGGIGGAMTISLVVGPAEELLDRGVRLLVLPCRDGLLPAVGLVEARRGLGVAPCDDGVLDPGLRHVVASGLSPRAQADALAERLDRDPGAILPADTARGRRVRALLPSGDGGSPLYSPEAPESVRPPAGSASGTIFATYGFPEPGSRTDEFYERFKAVYGRRPESILAALAADALEVLAIAIETAASIRPAEVAAAIREGIELRGVMGEIEFPGGTSRPIVDAVILRAEAGRLELVGSD